MTDLKAIEAAEARVVADPTLPDRIAGECRRMSGFVRRAHPRGYAFVDNVLDAGLREASSFPRGGGMLRSVERLQRRLEELGAEADAESARLAKIADAAAMDRRLALQAGGAVGIPRRDPAFLDALAVCRDRVESLRHRSESSEEAFAATLDDADLAIKALASAIGIARRAARIRRSAEAASAAAAVASAAVAPALAA